MNNEQVFFLKLISDYLNRNVTTSSGDIDWKYILRYAREQELEGVVFYQCRYYLEKLKNGLESQTFGNMYDSLKQSYSKTVFPDVRMTAAFFSSSSVGNEGAIRMLLSFGSFPYG